MNSTDEHDGLSPAGFKGQQGRTPDQVEKEAGVALALGILWVAFCLGIGLFALASWIKNLIGG